MNMKRIHTLHEGRTLYMIDGLLLFLFVGFFVYSIAVRTFDFLNPSGVEYVEENYGQAIEDVAKEYEVSPDFLKALCMLESGGRKHVKPRFEKHIFNRLKRMRDTGKGDYETITAEQLANASDDALRNLASSWGPFQIMGYKCMQLDIKVKDLRGPRAVHWAMKWIDVNYGDILRAKRYADAFHHHNTGSPMRGRSRTHDPNYVRNGLKYMKEFEAMKEP